jgi:hypothetical protein
VPDGLWRFSKGVLQWQARTWAYTFFLSDHYPPFETGDAAYPVAVWLEQPDRFNRWAVLFRAILAIPAGIVEAVFTFGVYAFSVAIWLITLVLGRCPRSLHLMVAAWLRYQLRYTAYYGLLTTAYPSAALGDRQTTYGSLASGEIILRGASRALAVIAIVLGSLLYASELFLPALIGVTPASLQTETAIIDLNLLQSRTLAAEAKYRTNVDRCAGTWRCVNRQTPILGQQLQTQIVTIEGITSPNVRTRRDAHAVLSVLDEENAAVSRMQRAGTPQAFESDAGRLVTLTRRLAPLVQKLQDDLGSGF